MKLDAPPGQIVWATTGPDQYYFQEQPSFTSTSLVSEMRPLPRWQRATPCKYCGMLAPLDVYQCLGCGAPR